MDKLAMTLGWLVGRRVAGQREKRPVAYLYNGVQLPLLPESDLPYAVIGKNGEDYWLFMSTSAMHIYPSGITTYISTPCLQYKHLDGEWVADNFNFVTEHNTFVGIPVWANHDVMKDNYDEADTLYLAASDPIPVYE